MTVLGCVKNGLPAPEFPLLSPSRLLTFPPISATSPPSCQLNSTGEEIVLHAMIWIAEGILRANWEKPDFDYLVDTAFEDTDVLML